MDIPKASLSLTYCVQSLLPSGCVLYLSKKNDGRL